MSPRKFHVLISNDDGIDAPGIYALVREMRKIAEVTVVAPDKQQSAIGHAITMSYPLRAVPFRKDGEFFGTAVEGTPADAVKLGVRFLMKKKPDLLISGINHGSNTAINILYSGTVSAATEGTLLGIPSIALSLTTHDPADFSYAASFGARLARVVVDKGLPSGTLLNVNVPAVPEAQIAGVRVTRQGESVWEDTFEARRDPANREYFWLTGRMHVTDTDPLTDQVAVGEKYISITPIHYELTDRSTLEAMAGWHLEKLK
ncbi:MAG TPA: 5'/3'-nucleotidase SurE [Bacteroidota bacterium]|nr:5'/3'-nucleotidase SurE [Bacteroidota bacterium]